jgi:hypothetical protein
MWSFVSFMLISSFEELQLLMAESLRNTKMRDQVFAVAFGSDGSTKGI